MNNKKLRDLEEDFKLSVKLKVVRKLSPEECQVLIDFINNPKHETVEPVTDFERFKGEGWISVEDRLPEVGEEVNVLTTKRKVTSLSRFIPYEGSEEYYWDNRYPGKGNTHLSRAVVKWQPLPKPPEINDDKE